MAGRKETAKVAEVLAARKLQTAEHYVSKQRLRETTDQIMDAIRIS
jgi:phosphohistidine phosphatase SixA